MIQIRHSRVFSQFCQVRPFANTVQVLFGFTRLVCHQISLRAEQQHFSKTNQREVYTGSRPVSIRVYIPLFIGILMLKGIHILIDLETYIQVRIRIELTFFAKELEFLIIFQNGTYQTFITYTVFHHLFINIIRWLNLSPAVIHTPAFVFQNHTYKFNTTTGRTAVGRNRPNILLVPKIFKIRREYFSKSVSQVTVIISFQ